MTNETIAHPYLSKFDTVEKLEQYLFLAGYTKKRENLTPNEDGCLDEDATAKAGEFAIRRNFISEELEDWVVGHVVFHPTITNLPELSNDCGIFAQFDAAGAIRKWLTFEIMGGSHELIDPDYWSINNLQNLILQRYGGHLEEDQPDPTMEAKQLWFKGKVERLSIYGSSKYLIELMGRLAEEKAEGIHSMELLKKCQGSNEEVIF